MGTGFRHWKKRKLKQKRSQQLKLAVYLVKGHRLRSAVMKYGKSSKEVTVLGRGLAFANGVAMSKKKNRSFVLVAETITGNIIRYWLKGSRLENPAFSQGYQGIRTTSEGIQKGSFGWLCIPKRDPRKFHYSGTARPELRKGNCKKGDSYEFAHGAFKCWLHPARYRTQSCKDRSDFRQRVCFFAPTPEQFRVLPHQSIRNYWSVESYDGSPLHLAFDSYLSKGILPLESYGVANRESASCVHVWAVGRRWFFCYNNRMKLLHPCNGHLPVHHLKSYMCPHLLNSSALLSKNLFLNEF